ncbi:MAG: crossover junction endodeoxyribonuclease RuvC [Planctomycetota bacterium]|nr:crossover junction endodeoxyribonuclease RuvC [Planctomycetota bacterium]
MSANRIARASAEEPIVLGVDPGTRVVGYGAVAAARRGPRYLACGVIRAPAKLPVPERLARIRRALDELLAELRPNVVVVESVFAGRNVRSALRIGEGRGLALAAAAERGCEVVEYAPAVAKKALVGNGAASKHQVRAMVRVVLRLEEDPGSDDATDALALAIAYVHRMGMLDAVRRARR